MVSSGLGSVRDPHPCKEPKDMRAFRDMRDVSFRGLRHFRSDIFWSLKFDTNFPAVNAASRLKMKKHGEERERESELDRSDGKLNYVPRYVRLTARSLLDKYFCKPIHFP
jgi:hypothetical protein